MQKVPHDMAGTWYVEGLMFRKPTVKIIGLGLWCLTLLSHKILAILWRSVLLAEETGVHRENH